MMSIKWLITICAALSCIASASAQTVKMTQALRDIACPDHQIDGEVVCHALMVAENPGKPDARTIPIRIMVLRAKAAKPNPDPLFVLPGGPGQSAIEEPGLRKFFAGFFAPVREARDIVFVDQRGTGGSNALKLEPAAERFFVRPEMNIPPEWGRAALDRLQSQADLAQYTTARAVGDLDAVRSALGYDRINLYGTSYGTRAGQYYIKRYGAHVRSAVFKAVMPPASNIALSYGQNPQRALRKLFDLCAADKACAAAHPKLESRLTSVLARLDKKPITVETKHPISGESIQFTVTRGNFAFGLRSLMMNASTLVQLPALIAQAAEGDFSAWTPFLVRVRALYASRLYGGMAFSVIAAEDVPRLTEKAVRADATGTLIGDALARGFAELGEFWPQGAAPADLFAPLKTNVPVLLVSGALDPATPPDGAEAMLKGLPNGRHVVYAGGAHSAANFPDLDRIIADFIRTGSNRSLDLSVAEANRPMPFPSSE